MRPLKNNNGFMFIEVLVVVFVVVLIAIVSYLAFKHKDDTGVATKHTTTTSSEWKTATFTGDRLKLRYPADWAASTDSVTSGLLVEKTNGNGKFIIRLEFATDGLIANAGGNAGYKPVTSFVFNGATAYVISDSVGGAYYVSSCPAPSLCFFSPKYSTTHKGIDEDLTYLTPGQQMEDTLPNDPASLAEAKQIMATLSY